MNVKYSSCLPAREDLFEIYEHLGWNEFLHLSAEQLLTAMENSWFSVYAYCEGKLVATGRVVSDGQINAYLCGLGVHKDYRGQGIGTEICRRLAEECQQHNLHLQLLCHEHLVPYYERMGFHQFAQGMKL